MMTDEERDRRLAVNATMARFFLPGDSPILPPRQDGRQRLLAARDGRWETTARFVTARLI